VPSGYSTDAGYLSRRAEIRSIPATEWTTLSQIGRILALLVGGDGGPHHANKDHPVREKLYAFHRPSCTSSAPERGAAGHTMSWNTTLAIVTTSGARHDVAGTPYLTTSTSKSPRSTRVNSQVRRFNLDHGRLYTQIGANFGRELCTAGRFISKCY